MRKLVCQGKVQYLALGLSVAVHTVALGVFTGVKLSNPVTCEVSDKPVSMQMIETALEQPAVKPKPQVHPVPKIAPAPETNPQAEPLVVNDQESSAEHIPEPPAIAEPDPFVQETAVHEVEFFGQKSIVQRICYVVDCSGSMYGQMYRVKEQLKQSIMKLDPHQAFCVLFFMDGRQILMTGSGRLISATVSTKSQALALIEKIKPVGSTDATHALECAMRLRDDALYGPEVIYFLTDGFDLDDSGSQLFVEDVCSLRKTFVPSAIVHTIGFWPENRDRRMLETLAQNTGGNYIEVQ